MPTILQINKAYYPHIGGIETVVNQYVNWLGLENQVDVLCVNSKREIKSTRHQMKYGTIYRSSSFGTLLSLPLSISFFLTFFRIRKNYDIIHFHEPFPLGSLLAWFIPTKTKVIITWHSDIVKQKITKIPFLLFQHQLCSRAQVILTTSDNLKLKSEIISGYAAKTQIVPLSIDTSEYPNIEKSSEYKLPERYALFFGRFSSYKGMSVLLEAFNDTDLHEIPLVIVGHGKLSKKHIEIISARSNIQLIDMNVSEYEKKIIFQNCYVYLFPSISNNEAFGITQLEAMVYGKPVINTNLPTGVPVVSIHNETGYTIPIKDSIALKQAIISIYAMNEQKYQNMSDNCVKRVKDLYDDEVVKAKILSIYKNLFN